MKWVSKLFSESSQSEVKLDDSLAENNHGNAASIFKAAACADLASVKALMYVGAVDEVDEVGMTALHHACGRHTLHLENYADRLLVVRFLLSCGADADKRCNHGFTPIMLAALYDERAEITELLCHQYADKGSFPSCLVAALNCSLDGDVTLDRLDWLTKHYASYDEPYFSKYAKLIKHSNDVRISRAEHLVKLYGTDGEPTFQGAVSHNLSLFVLLNEFPTLHESKEDQVLIIQKLSDRIYSKTTSNDLGDLIGYERDTAYPMNRRPVHPIAKTKNHNISQFDVINMCILSNFFDPNIRLKDGKSWLHVAVMSGDLVLVECLVKRGARLTLDNDGLSPMDYARPEPSRPHFRWREIIRVLLSTD
jgi:ankyrin repeat protein